MQHYYRKATAFLAVFLLFAFYASAQYTKEYYFQYARYVYNGRLAAQSVIPAGNGYSVAVYNVSGNLTFAPEAEAAAVAQPLTDIAVTRFDPSGNPVWTTFFGIPSLAEWANSLTMTSDGGYLIVGRRTNSSGVNSVLALKVNSTGGLVWATDYPTGSNSSEGISVIRSYDLAETFIVSGTLQNTKTRLFVMKIDGAWGNNLWAKTYTSIAADAANIDNLPTTIAAVTGGFIIAGQHTYAPPLLKATNNVFAVKIDNGGNLLSQFNTYNITPRAGDANSYKPGIQYIPANNSIILAFGSGVPSPFPSHPVPPIAGCTSIAAAIGIDQNFTNNWAYLYWSLDALEMACHSIYYAYSSNLGPKSGIFGLVKHKFNNKYSPFFSAIDQPTGQLSRYLSGYNNAHNLYSSFTMYDAASAKPFQYINMDQQYRLSLVRTSNFGSGLCQYDSNYAYKNVPSNRTIYTYSPAAVTIFPVSPLIDQLSMPLLQDPCGVQHLIDLESNVGEYTVEPVAAP